MYESLTSVESNGTILSILRGNPDKAQETLSEGHAKIIAACFEYVKNHKDESDDEYDESENENIGRQLSGRVIQTDHELEIPCVAVCHCLLRPPQASRLNLGSECECESEIELHKNLIFSALWLRDFNMKLAKILRSFCGNRFMVVLLVLSLFQYIALGVSILKRIVRVEASLWDKRQDGYTNYVQKGFKFLRRQRHAMLPRGSDKFDPKGRGYPTQQKGYRLFDLATKEIYHSRDVVFQETIWTADYIMNAIDSDTTSSVRFRTSREI
ncbi:hypothetical protein V2J09_003343 [Rumex salicifolius]